VGKASYILVGAILPVVRTSGMWIVVNVARKSCRPPPRRRNRKSVTRRRAPPGGRHVGGGKCAACGLHWRDRAMLMMWLALAWLSCPLAPWRQGLMRIPSRRGAEVVGAACPLRKSVEKMLLVGDVLDRAPAPRGPAVVLVGVDTTYSARRGTSFGHHFDVS